MPTSPTQSDHLSIQTISTATYERQEQEAEERYREQVEELCRNLWPPPENLKQRLLASSFVTRLRTISILRSITPRPQTPLIEHLKGGGFNHISSIKLPPLCATDGHRDLILRVPREEDSRPDRQVATLNFVREKTSIPVPKIAAADFTCNNALGKPYVLQHRVPGRDLESVWDEITHAQRLLVAKQLGHVLKALLSVESPHAGIIEAGSGASEFAKLPNIVPIKIESQGEPLELTLEGATRNQPTRTTLDFFESYLGSWRQDYLTTSGGVIDAEVSLYDQLLTTAREMDDLGLFKPDINCLCHLDLHERRNIMVQLNPSSTTSLSLTAILDWDEAIFAPKFVNCQPPAWLWGYDKDTHVDEDDMLPWPYELAGADEEPKTWEQRELKCAFDEAAGGEYVRLAYGESSRLGRGLFRLATLGLNASWYVAAAERIVREWSVLKDSMINGSSLE